MAAADIEDARGDATEDTRGRDRWAAFRVRPEGARHLSSVALILCVAAVGAMLLSAQVIDSDQLPAAAIVIVAFAVVLGTLVGIVRWAYAALAERVDILTQALDASPDPQLI